jgi:hypothetical protein
MSWLLDVWSGNPVELCGAFEEDVVVSRGWRGRDAHGGACLETALDLCPRLLQDSGS